MPVIKEFFASEQHRTGRPIPGTIPDDPPYRPDSNRKTADPFSLEDWLDNHKEEINRVGFKNLFDSSYQSNVLIYGQGTSNDLVTDNNEIWLWQLVTNDNLRLLIEDV